MKIGGKEHKLKFGLNQSILYCELRKISVNQMNEEFASFADGTYNGSEIRDLLWSALKDGARVAKKPFNKTNYDIGDLMENMSEAEMSSFLLEMADSMPKPKKK